MWMYWYEWHSLCSYVSIGLKYCVSKVLFSLLVCMYWPFKTSTPSQSEIFSLCLYEQGKSQWSSSDYTEYFTLRGCTGLGRPIHTYEQREQDLGDRIFLANSYIWAKRERRQSSYHLIVWEDLVWSSLFQNSAAWAGNNDVWLCNWIWKTLHR